MFDDRVEITSPGGMFGGGSIQEYDIYSIRSMQRNPVIADLFHRMKYMERRGSGLRKIVSETEKLPGYTAAYKPEFSSTATDFRVILKNVNYNMCGASVHVAAHDTSVISKQNLLLEFCADPKSRDEMQAYIDVSSRFVANCADAVCTIISLTSACDRASLFSRTAVPDQCRLLPTSHRTVHHHLYIQR